MERRRVLSVAGSGIALGLAGCLDGGPSSGTGETTDDESADDDTPSEAADDGAVDDGGDDSNDDDGGDDPSDDDGETADGADDGEAEPDADDGEQSDGSGEEGGTGDGDEDTGDGDSDDGAGDGADDEDDDSEDEDDADGETHTLTVSVVDSTAEVPLEATVDIAGDTRETGSDGEVTYDLPAGEYEVTATSEVYQDSVVSVDLEGEESVTMELVPAEADLELLESDLSREDVDGDEAYVLRGTIANSGTVPSEEAVIEVVLYDTEGTRVHERYSAPLEIPAESEQEFEFVAMYNYNSAFEDVDPDNYEVGVFSYVGHRRLARVDEGSTGFSFLGALSGLFA